jgi:hypothetical protein
MFNIQKFHLFSHYVCVFCTDHRTNMYFCLIQYNIDWFCMNEVESVSSWYALSPYIKELRFIVIGLNWVTLPSGFCESR